MLAGGYWYARNLVAVGNPLPWTSLGVLPTPAAPLQQHTGFSIAHYLTSSGAWSHHFAPGLAADLARWWFAIVGLAIVGPILCLARGAGRTVRMLGARGPRLARRLPDHARERGRPGGDPAGFAFNLRYAAPPLALSLAILPLAPVLEGPRRQAAVIAVLMAALLATMIRPSLWPDRHVLGVSLLAAALLLGGAALVAMRLRAPSRLLVLCLAAVLLLAGAAAGYGWQRHYLRGRYQFNPGVSYLSHVWAYFRGVRDARGRGGRDVRRVLRVPAVGPGRLQPRAVHRRPRPARVVRRDRQLPTVATGDQCRPLPLRRHDPGARPLAPQATEPLARGSLDRHRSQRPAGAEPARPGSADRGVPDPGTAEPSGLRADKPAIILHGP